MNKIPQLSSHLRCKGLLLAEWPQERLDQATPADCRLPPKVQGAAVGRLVPEIP